MADFWIIIGVDKGRRLPRRHATLEAATAERDRLQGLAPEKYFHVYRAKTHLYQSGRYEMMRAALAELAPDRLAEIDACVDAIPMCSALTEEAAQ